MLRNSFHSFVLWYLNELRENIFTGLACGCDRDDVRDRVRDRDDVRDRVRDDDRDRDDGCALPASQ